LERYHAITIAMNKQAFENLLQTSDPVTPQEISDFDQYRKLKRESLFLFQKPIKTIVTFLHGVAYFTTHCIRYIFSHQLFLFFVIPLCVLWPLARNLPEPYALWVKSIEFYFEYIVWWVGLGVLSSVGLGSGLQSGVLFLFPHIIKVSLAAQTCNTLDFESSSDMWFRNPPNLFRCPDVAANSTPVTFIGIWQKIILVCFLQSTGTAIGEIPPYWMTKSARIASLQTQHSLKEEFPEELEANSSYSIVNRGKVFLIWFLNKYGFYGVLIMASYPNIAFDLCGICCGHFLMPFWSFFIATFLGKAVIRNSYQSFFYVMICR
jgi:membrane protein YqaA with SNARE-associated domain